MKLIKEMFKELLCPLWVMDKNNEITYVNKVFNKEFKLNKDEEKLLNEQIIAKKDYARINNKNYRQMIFSYNNLTIGIMNYVEDKQDNENILRIVIDNIPELIFYKDKELRYMGLNKECEKFYKDRGIYDVIGKKDLDLPLDKEFIKTCTEHDTLVINSKETLYIAEYVPIPNSDEKGIVQTIKTPIINEDGDVTGLVGVVRDITMQKKLEEKLRYLSYTDSLTELYNRTYFDKKTKDLIDESQYPIGLILGDINGLKILNDTFGHIEGDKLLKSIANVLSKACPEKGTVFRWGGDEFITLIPSTSEEECEEFISKVNQYCNEEKNESFRLSISQGYALNKPLENIDTTLSIAEEKLYKQKIITNKSFRRTVLSSLVNKLEIKSIETKEHTKRMEKYCIKIGEKLNLNNKTINELKLASRFHDIGKVAIPDDILLKTGELTEDEFEVMKTHPEKGYRLALLLPEVSHISREILTHHERWDGKGYPLGLKEEEIPFIARIISVLDAYDMMTNDTLANKARSKEYALSELRKNYNKQFDGKIVDVLCEIIEAEI